MSQLNCDIVKDLMPSYLDSICSESSRKAVEKHLLECTKCRDTLNMLQNTSLVSQAAEKGQLDFMKKVKQHYLRRNTSKILMLYILSLLILILSTYFFWGDALKIILFYYTIFPILSLGTWLLLSDHPKKPKQNNFRIITGSLSALGILGCLLTELFLCNSITQAPDKPLLFGLALSQIGPLLNFSLIAMAIVELLLFALLTAYAIKQGYSQGYLPTLSLAGCILCLTLRLYLYYMSTADELSATILQTNKTVFLETAAILLLEFLLCKIRQKHLAATDSTPVQAK